MGKVTKLIGTAGIITGAAIFAKKENRKKLVKSIKKLKPSYAKNAVTPEDIQDANMVNEGAMTSIMYYNHIQEE